MSDARRVELENRRNADRSEANFPVERANWKFFFCTVPVVTFDVSSTETAQIVAVTARMRAETSRV